MPIYIRTASGAMFCGTAISVVFLGLLKSCFTYSACDDKSISKLSECQPTNKPKTNKTGINASRPRRILLRDIIDIQSSGELKQLRVWPRTECRCRLVGMRAR